MPSPSQRRELGLTAESSAVCMQLNQRCWSQQTVRNYSQLVHPASRFYLGPDLNYSGRFAMKKIAVFVDVQNIYYTVKECHGCHFNYRALWRQLSQEGDIVIANAYAIERNDAQQQGFQKILRA